jgi:hypothetical protein
VDDDQLLLSLRRIAEPVEPPAAFLDAIGDGTLPPEAFNRWLVQDYHFADALTSFQGIAAAKTPRQLRKPLIAGLGALDAELDWFEEFIDRWSNPRFADYVESLRVLAEDNLHEASQGYFDGVFHCLGAGREKDRLCFARERRDRIQLFTKLYVGLVGDDLERSVREGVELTPHRFDHLGMAMSGVEHRDTTGEVDVATPVDVP